MKLFDEKETETFIAALDYQHRTTDVVDLSVIMRSLCTAKPGLHERPKRIIDYSAPGRPRGTLVLKVPEPGRHAPVEYDLGMAAAKRLMAELVDDGQLKDDWRDLARALEI